MTHDATTLDGTRPAVSGRRRSSVKHLALVLVWSRSEPDRIGEVLLLPRATQRGPVVMGRGASQLCWARQRPGDTEETGPLADPKLSRRQLELTVLADGRMSVHNVGRGELHWGHGVEPGYLRPGQTCAIAGRAIFMATERPAHLSDAPSIDPSDWPAFGTPDRFGIVGESPVTWRLRDTLGRVAAMAGHVLVLGPSGSGKELCARALHGLSDRRRGPWLAHNAAAIPEGLVAAELFGNRRGYPNAGSPERLGLVGEAHRGVLLLDEVGELTQAAQAALLRVLDHHGEYQRLGESRTRHSDLRVVGATNRPVTDLKSDFAARFPIRIEVPPLTDHLEDIPLIARHVLRERAPSQPLMQALLGYDFPLQVRELNAALLQAVSESGDGPVALTEAVRTALIPSPGHEPTIGPRVLSADTLRAALAANYGDRDATARSLGLPSRYAVYRLMKKLGVTTQTPPAQKS